MMATISPALRHQVIKNWTVIAALAGFILWALAVAQAHFFQMGAYGLVTILRWPYFVSLVVLCVALVAEIFRGRSSEVRLTVLMLVLVLILFGTASAVEPVASITESWIHTGFISYVLDHGHVLHGYDARFSWPGGFVLAAMLTTFVGHANSLVFIRWFPLVIEALYLAPVMVIGAHAGVSRRTKWLGVAFFYATDWIYQDYFSPQALDFFFYLVVIASVMALWSPSRRSYVTGQGLIATKFAQVRNAVKLKRITGDQTVAQYQTALIFPLMAMLALIILAIVMSHQLTPYALILALLACLATSRLGRPELLAIAVIFSVGWLSLGASDFWIGHLSVIFGGVGQLTNNIGSGIGSRVVGSTSHLFIVSTRIDFTAVVILMAGIGALRRATDSRALEFLAGAPFVILALQGYGGEGLLRVVLFGLPFTALLAASAIVPTRTGEVRPWIPPTKWLHSFATLRRVVALRPVVVTRRRVVALRPVVATRRRVVALRPVVATLRPATTLRPVVAGVVLMSMCVLTTIVRGGNDAYESFSTGELNAVNYVYDHATTNQVLGTVTTYLPIGQRDVGTLNIFAVGGSDIPTLAQISTSLLKLRPKFIILSQSQEAWGEVVGGYPKGWEAQLGLTILKKDYQQVATWPTAQVYEAFNKWGPLPA